MASFLVVVFLLHASHSLAPNCVGGTGPCQLFCNGVDSCKHSMLTCRPNYPCEIVCNGKSSCTDSIMSANGATDFKLTCYGEDACKKGTVSCGTDKCALNCAEIAPFSNVCLSVFVHKNAALSFQCTGDCPLDIMELTYSASPTIQPTLSPLIITQNPTKFPTNMPTNIPTHMPTQFPTNIPTQFPTHIPSLTPTNTPTKFPTNIPTNVPTNVPTYFPTNSPTNIPSISPTQNLIFPIQNPSTDAPTNIPTNNPSFAPTNTPTKYPTIQPTNTPTIKPTSEPTTKPHRNPSIFPTNVPTQTPTQKPSKSPTNPLTFSPTHIPTHIPTVSPSYNPTAIPSYNPTVIPSVMPTDKPTVYHPTFEPTLKPLTNPMQTTQTDRETDNGNCSNTRNMTNVFTFAAMDKSIPTERDKLIMYGILNTITFDYEFELLFKDAANIIDIITDIMHKFMNILLTNNNCVSSRPIEIKTIHSYASMTIDLSIFVCNQAQQKQLLTIFEANKNDILCEIIRTIDRHIGVVLSLDNALIITDTIYEARDTRINTTVVTPITDIVESDTNNATLNMSHEYYGIHGSHLQTALLIIVGSLAVTSMIIACAIFLFNSRKMKDKYNSTKERNQRIERFERAYKNKQSFRDKMRHISNMGSSVKQSNSQTNINIVNNHITAMNIERGRFNFKSAKRSASETPVEVESYSGEHMNRNNCETNGNRVGIADLVIGKPKCSCSCHSSEILSVRECNVCCDCASEEMWAAEIKQSMDDGHLRKGVSDVVFEMGNDRSPPTTTYGYEMPLHASV